MQPLNGTSRRWPALVEPSLLALAIALFAIQALAISHIAPDGDWAWLRRATFFVATPVFVVLALHFRRFIGAWLIAAGIAMNFVPMAAHGGNMPVAYEVVRDSGAFPSITQEQIGSQLHNSKDVLLWKDDIHFYPLSDHIVLTLPGYRTNIYSPGDAVIAAGVLVAAIEAVAFAFGVTWRSLLQRMRSPRHTPAPGAGL